METMENENQERCRVFINDNDGINQIGCDFFAEALNSPPTFISSNKLRWLTYQFNDKEKRKSKEDAWFKIMTEAEQRNNPHGLADRSHNFSMKILLYTDPTKLSDAQGEHIKSLLKCIGVDIRYLETKEEQRLRISLRGTKLFLSMSNEPDTQVCEGILYEAKNKDSLLIAYFREKFRQDFERAKKVKLDKHGRIVNADTWWSLLWKKISSDRWIAIIGLFIGFISLCLGIVSIICCSMKTH